MSAKKTENAEVAEAAELVEPTPEETPQPETLKEDDPIELSEEEKAAEAAEAEAKELAAKDAELAKDISKVTPVGEDPFILISRNAQGTELKAARVANRGILVSNGFGLVFIEGGSIVQQGGNNAITA